MQQRHILKALLEKDALLESNCSPYDDTVLLEYIQAELNGQDIAALFPAFRAHLEQASECWQEYSELKHLLALMQAGQLAEPPGEGLFDFSFLNTATDSLQNDKHLGTTSFWRFDALGRLIIEFSNELLRVLQPTDAQLAYAVERSERGAQIRYQLTLQEELEDLRIAITVRDEIPRSDQFTLVVEANIPSRGGWPYLTDTDVILKRGQQTLDQQFTDPFGKAVFSNVRGDDLEHLIIEIAPNRD